MNKNPFEIRTELLAMAKDFLDRKYDNELSYCLTVMNQEVEKGNFVDWQKNAPKGYTTEDIIREAQLLYSFVSKKD
jgi:hypothetical protein